MVTQNKNKYVQVELAIGRAGPGWAGPTMGWAKTRPVGPKSLLKAKKIRAGRAGSGHTGPGHIGSGQIWPDFFSGQ